MRRFRVSLTAGETMEFGPFGRASIGYEHSVTVPDDATKQDAIDKAKAEVAAMRDWSKYQRVTGVEEIFTWWVTLRGADDKRRRETYIVPGATEYEALRNLGYNSAASRFARYHGPKLKLNRATGKREIQPDARVVRIEQQGRAA